MALVIGTGTYAHQCTITGTVRDPSGAEVTAVRTEIGIETKASPRGTAPIGSLYDRSYYLAEQAPTRKLERFVPNELVV